MYADHEPLARRTELLRRLRASQAVSTILTWCSFLALLLLVMGLSLPMVLAVEAGLCVAQEVFLFERRSLVRELRALGPMVVHRSLVQ